jgi:hypothetical protein
MTLPPVGLPRDPAQWLALAVAAGVLAAARPLVRASPRPRLFVAAGAMAAAALSAAYVAVYLRGGPRIIDATSYYLQGRALSEGFLSFPLGAPESAVLGRFLVRSEHAGVAHAAGIFPPGYPAVLALGFLAGAPLSVGPLLAAALAIVTFDLAGRLPSDPGAPSSARLALLFSVVCGALRYHTADTMSHGLAALCFAGALTFLFRAVDAARGRARLLAVGAGLCAGWLFATRPVSALALGAVIVFVLARDGAARASAPRLLAAIAIGAIPGVALFLAHQHAATGAWGVASQRLYYAVSDGPPGCFRYGFGAGVGCIGEHGDFVASRLSGGYGFLAAAGTTLRRLKMHLVDPANLEPLALLVPAGAYLGRASPRGRALGLAVLAQVLAYVPFYFDGNYPGGGGRFFCDVLPVEHVLIAVAVAAWAARRAAPERCAASVLALALAGFAFRAGFDHAALRDRDGGRPFFEPSELARAGISRGLVFLDSDHGFDLAFDPAPGALAFARFHGDALDWMAWEARGRPPAFRYRFVTEGGAPASVGVEPLAFPRPVPGRSLLVEGESLWPALSQRDGWALPEWAGGTCASSGRWLAVHPAGDGPAEIALGLPARWLAGRRVSARVAVGERARGELEMAGTRLRFVGAAGAGLVCLDLPPILVPPGIERLELTLRIEAPGSAGVPPGGSPLALDALLVQEPSAEEPPGVSNGRHEND